MERNVYKAAIITLSDKGYAGGREDKSGPLIKKLLEENGGYIVEEEILLPDEQKMLESEFIRLSDENGIDLILTTGGTGFSKRDKTPEATLSVATRNAPGIAEAMRYHSLQITPKAMFGRGQSVIRNETVIINLPGSPKAVRENLEYLLPNLNHGIEILKGTASECGREV